MPVKDVFAPKPVNIADVAAKQQIDEVQKTAEHINVIDRTRKEAGSLVGLDNYKEQITRQEAEMTKLREKNEGLQQQVQKSEVQGVKENLGQKIDALQESMKAGASQKDIVGQMKDLKAAAGELGMGQKEEGVSTLKTLITVIDQLRPTRTLGDQLKEAKELLALVTPEKKDEGKMLPGVSDAVQIQLAEMNQSTMLRLKEMEETSKQRDRDWGLTLRKYDDDKDIRQNEVSAQIQLQRERNQMISQGVKGAGAAIARAVEQGGGSSAAAPQGSPAPAAASVQRILEVEIGEAGSVNCEACKKGEIFVTEDATEAMCPNCNAIYAVKRVDAADFEPV